MQTEISTIDRRRFLRGLGACGCAGLAAGCTETNPATGRTTFTGFYSVQDDIRIGREQHPKLLQQFGGEYDNPKVARYVEQIGARAAQFSEYDFPYKFTVVNSPIVNAFALPGGFVYVSRGLVALAANEAELAGVICHEIGHVTARHTAERLSQAQLAQLGVGLLGIATGSSQVANLAGQGAMIFIQSHSRSQELEADTLGIRYMSSAGYDPSGMVTFLQTLREHSMFEAEMRGLPPGQVDDFNIMATHPRTQERVQQARVQAGAQNVVGGVVGRDPYLQTANGMLYGDDPEQGIVDDRRFVHPVLRFEFTVPQDFLIRNGQTQVAAIHPSQSLVLFDMSRTPRRVSMANYLRHEWGRGAQLSGLESLRIDGADAATAATRLSSNAGPRDVRPVAIRGDGDSVFRFLFVTPPNLTARYAEDFRRTTYSFRRLSEAEASAIQGRRLVVVPVHPQDTVASLSRTMPFGRFNEQAFRILNDLRPGEPLPSSGHIKVVAA